MYFPDIYNTQWSVCSSVLTSIGQGLFTYPPLNHHLLVNHKDAWYTTDILYILLQAFSDYFFVAGH